MNILFLAISLLFERALGVSFIVIPLLTVILFNIQKEQMAKFSLFAGILIDIFFGYRLGLSSILLLLSSFEFSLYKSKIESSNLWSLFLLGLLVSIQSHIFWNLPESISDYFFHAITSVILYVLIKSLSSRRSDGVYLRR